MPNRTQPVDWVTEAEKLILSLRSVKRASISLEGDEIAEINILADRSIPFRVLRKVMAICGEARFARISLAVVEKRPGAGT